MPRIGKPIEVGIRLVVVSGGKRGVGSGYQCVCSFGGDDMFLNYIVVMVA